MYDGLTDGRTLVHLLQVALEALRSTDELQRKVALIKREKVRVIQALQQLPFVRAVYASDSNFILFEVRAHVLLSLLPHTSCKRQKRQLLT